MRLPELNNVLMQAWAGCSSLSEAPRVFAASADRREESSSQKVDKVDIEEETVAYTVSVSAP